MNFKLFLKIVFLLSLVRPIGAFSQQTKIDSLSFYTWPELMKPYISPNGKYIMYSINNHFSGLNKAVVRDLLGKWKYEITYKVPTYLNCELTDEYAVFIKGEDSLVVVTLGGDVSYYSGYKKFKVSTKGGDSFIAAGNDSKLMILNSHGFKIFQNVFDFYFVQDDTRLLLHTWQGEGESRTEKLVSLDLKNTFQKELWSCKTITSLITNSNKTKISFIAKASTNRGSESIICYDLSSDSHFSAKNNKYYNLYISKLVAFNYLDSSIIFQFRDTAFNLYRPNKLNLKIWSYNDSEIQVDQIEKMHPTSFYGSVSISRKELFKIQEEKDNWILFSPPEKWRFEVLISQTVDYCPPRESYWNKACLKNFYLVNLLDGKRVRLPEIEGHNPRNQYMLSPDSKYIVFYDYDSLSYYSFSIDQHAIRKLTGGQFYKSLSKPTDDYIEYPQRGIAGWSNDHRYVFIYSEYDIWAFDLTGKDLSVCLTNGHGKKNGIVYSFLSDALDYSLDIKNSIILRSLDVNTKFNGYYKTKFGLNDQPELLSSGPYITYIPSGLIAEHMGMEPLKAKNKDVYVIRKESSTEFPNYFLTKDFRRFDQISFIAPQKAYNWYNTQLVNWSLPDGKLVQGVLYKPQDFDSAKKYPVIFNIYEQFSNSLNAYIPPTPLCNGCDVNPAVIVNNGFLLFQPDIHQKYNITGDAALATVESAISTLTKYKWIDEKNIGLQGCSFGGFLTNYIISHSKLFKAACTASGISDAISWGSDHYSSIYSSFTWGQLRITKAIWDAPDLFVKNSPIFRVNEITTPLLLFHTTIDDAVPFNQGMELYLMLRRLDKPVWLLEYSGESANHGLNNREQERDFSLRMLQFFNHYLKGGPIPAWMKNGVKAKEAATRSGLEYISK